MSYSVSLCSSDSASSHLSCFHSSSITCGDATAQQKHFVQRRVAPDLCQRGVRNHSELAEGTDPQELVELLAPAGDPAGAVGQHAGLRVRPETHESSD